MTHLPDTTRDRPRTAARGRRAAAVAVVAAALLGASCSGSDGTSSSGSGSGASGSGDPATQLAACPVDALPDSGDPVEVTVWHPYSGPTKTVMDEIVAQYNASQTKVHVSAEAQGSSPELHKKFQESMDDDATLPEVMFTEDINLQYLADSGVVVPATSCVDAEGGSDEFVDALLPPVRSAYTLEDVLWPSAFGVATLMMYANDAQLRAAGIDSGAMPATLDELRTMAEQIRDAEVEGVTEPLVMKLDPWVLETLLTGADQEVVNEDNGRAAVASASELDDDTTTEVMAWIQGMVDDGLLKAVPYGDSIDDFLALANGTSTFTISGTRSITSVAAVMDGQDPGVDAGDAASQAALAELDLRAGLMPGVTEAGRSGVSGTAGYVLTGSDAEVAGAWDFLSYFNQVPQQVRWTLEGSYLPVTDAIRTDPAVVAAATTTRSGRWLDLVVGGMANLEADFPGPAIGPYAEYRDQVLQMMDGIASGAPVGETVTSTSDEVTKILESYRDEVGG